MLLGHQLPMVTMPRLLYGPRTARFTAADAAEYDTCLPSADRRSCRQSQSVDGDIQNVMLTSRRVFPAASDEELEPHGVSSVVMHRRHSVSTRRLAV